MLLLLLFYHQMFFWYLVCIRVFIPNPFQGSSSSRLLCTICDCAMEGSGDATSYNNRHAWDSQHFPLGHVCFTDHFLTFWQIYFSQFFLLNVWTGKLICTLIFRVKCNTLFIGFWPHNHIYNLWKFKKYTA